MTVPPEIVTTLKLILSGGIDPIEGCRLLVLHAEVLEKVAAPEFLVIAGVESETDDLPLGEERARWSKEALGAKDREKEAYLREVHAELRIACEAILQKVIRK
jgi:hypothetical protein